MHTDSLSKSGSGWNSSNQGAMHYKLISNILDWMILLIEFPTGETN